VGVVRSPEPARIINVIIPLAPGRSGRVPREGQRPHDRPRRRHRTPRQRQAIDDGREHGELRPPEEHQQHRRTDRRHGPHHHEVSLYLTNHFASNLITINGNSSDISEQSVLWSLKQRYTRGNIYVSRETQISIHCNHDNYVENVLIRRTSGRFCCR
jgi:hypothetical protein